MNAADVPTQKLAPVRQLSVDQLWSESYHPPVSALSCLMAAGLRPSNGKASSTFGIAVK